MTIITGTDFTSPARQANIVAARLAVRRGVPLLLVHAVDSLGAEHERFCEGEAAFPDEARRLQQEVDLIEKATGVRAHSILTSGPADQILIQQAGRVGADLIVIAATGRRDPLTWAIGSTAMRIVGRSHVPVLLIRDSAPLETWQRGSTRLHVLAAVDRRATDARVLDGLSRIFPGDDVDVLCAHAVDVSAEARRLGITGDEQASREEVLRVLRRELGETVTSAVNMRMLPVVGSVPSTLVEFAQAEQAALIAVGTRPAEGPEAAFHAVAARAIVHGAETNVLTVPLPTATSEAMRHVPLLRRVLAAADLSEGSGAAIPYAYSLLPAGGTVHLIHVLPPPDGLAARIWSDLTDAKHHRRPTKADVEARLRALIPPEAERLGITTDVHVVVGGDPATVIQSESERLGVDAVCIAARGAGVAASGIGSVARRLLARSRRPVFAVRPPQ